MQDSIEDFIGDVHAEVTSKLDDISTNLADLGVEILAKLDELFNEMEENDCLTGMTPWYKQTETFSLSYLFEQT